LLSILAAAARKQPVKSLSYLADDVATQEEDRGRRSISKCNAHVVRVLRVARERGGGEAFVSRRHGPRKRSEAEARKSAWET